MTDAREYNLKLEYNSVKSNILKNKYSFLHVTDTHLCLIGNNDTKAHIEYNTPRVGLFSSDGMTSDERLSYFFSYARDTALDAVIMTGDIIDQPSDDNLNKLKSELRNAGVKYIYMFGNHDWSFADNYRTEDARNTYCHRFDDIYGGNKLYQLTEYEDLVVLSIDNGMETFLQEHILAFEEACKMNKPIVLAMHIPITMPELAIATAKVWGRNICIGEGGVGNNNISREFISRVFASDSPCIAILSGHVHLSHTESISSIPQFVTSVGSYGYARSITFSS